MILRCVCAALLLLFLARAADHEPLRVFGANPQITVLLMLLYPHGLVGLNYKPYPEDLLFMPARLANLPVLGGVMQGREVSFEKLVSLRPHVVFFPSYTPQQILKPYQDIGIKTVLINTDSLDDLHGSIVEIGHALGIIEHAEALNEFIDGTRARHKQLLTQIKHRPSVYLAQGNDGLQTQCFDDSKPTQDLVYQLGGVNIIRCETLANPYSRVHVNFETLTKFNPDIIFVREIALYKNLLHSPSKSWSRLKAVRNKNVYYAPSSPSNWLMRPPTVMQSIGILWGFSKVQPDMLTDTEVRQIAKRFFKRFLRTLSDDEYLRLQGLQ